MVEVSKRGEEKVESMLRRFKKQLQRSGILNLARDHMYFEKKKSKGIQRRDAVKRSEIRKEKDLLRKMGKLDNQVFK